MIMNVNKTIYRIVFFVVLPVCFASITAHTPQEAVYQNQQENAATAHDSALHWCNNALIGAYGVVSYACSSALGVYDAVTYRPGLTAMGAGAAIGCVYYNRQHEPYKTVWNKLDSCRSYIGNTIRSAIAWSIGLSPNAFERDSGDQPQHNDQSKQIDHLSKKIQELQECNKRKDKQLQRQDQHILNGYKQVADINTRLEKLQRQSNNMSEDVQNIREQLQNTAIQDQVRALKNKLDSVSNMTSENTTMLSQILSLFQNKTNPSLERIEKQHESLLDRLSRWITF